MGVFKNNLKDDDAYVNGIGRFDIEVNSDDAVEWSQNGKKLESNAQLLKFEMVQDGSKRSLIVKNVTKSDFCKYSATCGGETKDAQLKQKSPFTKKIQNAEGYMGGIAVFNVEVCQGCQVTWYWGNKKINKQNFSMLKFEEQAKHNKKSLIVKNITSADFADFSVESKGEKCSAKLTKMSPWVESHQNAEGPIGGIAVFEVKVRPAVQVKWFFGNKEINKKNFSILKFEQVWEGDYRRLLVKNITEQDYTDFSVEAKGDKVKAKLVKGSGKNKPAPKKVESKVQPKSAQKSQAAPPAAPKKTEKTDAFSQLPKNLDGKSGKIEVFECKMKDSNMTVKWFKDNKEINSKSFSILKYESISEGNTRKLIVKNISSKDSGKYFVEATDGSKCECSLSVGGKGGATSGGAERSFMATKAEKSAYSFKPQESGLRSDYGIMIPLHMPQQKIRDYVLSEVHNRDVESNKKWIRNPDSWNSWIRNPQYAN